MTDDFAPIPRGAELLALSPVRGIDGNPLDIRTSRRKPEAGIRLTSLPNLDCHLFSILLLILSFKYHSIPIMRAT